MRTSARLLVTALALASQVACVTTAIGRGPTERDLENDGGTEVQLDLYRAYEVTYEQSTFKRPGADPAAVAKEAGLQHVDSVMAAAWGDDAYNYVSSSRRAAEVMEHPAIAFDGFAHSGMGETVLVGVGFGGGMVTGAVAWFAATTVRDGITEAEFADLYVTSSTGLLIGGTLGVIIAAAYTYIVPNVSTPFAVPFYRKAAQVFNEDLEDRIIRNSPHGDAPPVAEDDDGDVPADDVKHSHTHGHDGADAHDHPHDHEDGEHGHNHDGGDGAHSHDPGAAGAPAAGT